MTEPRLGGYSDVARHLGLMHNERQDGVMIRRPYRQMIYNWFGRRESNGFPEPRSMSPDGQPLFDLAEVEAWYDQYIPAVGGRPNTTGRPPRKRKKEKEDDQ